MFVQLYRKIKEYFNLRTIKKSGYLETNEDLKNLDIKPIYHYYTLGWKEHRNPSASFDNDMYLMANARFKIRMNPVLHYMKYGRFDERIVGPENKFKKSIHQLMKLYFYETTPIKTFPISHKRKRFNILFTEFNDDCLYNGQLNSLVIAILFANQYQFDLRIVANNPQEHTFFQFLNLYHLKEPKKIEFFARNSKQRLEISANDIFLCSDWMNACALLNTPEILGKIIYMMQEEETISYSHNDYYLKCLNTLKNNRLIPIINTKILYDDLIQNGYVNVKENGTYFEPICDKNVYHIENIQKKEKYALYYDAMASSEEDLFYFGLEVLNEAFNLGKLNPGEWTIYVKEDKKRPGFYFDSNVKIVELEPMHFLDYKAFLSTIDLYYTMDTTPNPRYSLLEACSLGCVGITNAQTNNSLENYSKNIITSSLNAENMLEAFQKGETLVKDIEQRKENYKNAHLLGEWQDAFKEVLPFIYKKIEDDQDV